MRQISLLIAACLSVSAFSGSNQVRRDPTTYSAIRYAKPATLPMRPNARSLVAIDVMIDGHGPYLFGIDTCAAGGGRISSELADKLALKTTGEVRAGDGTGVNTQTRKLRRADKLSIGGITFCDVDLLEHGNVTPPAGATSGPAVDGIIGFGLFKELLLKVDFVKHLVTVSKGKVEPGPNAVALDDAMGVSQVQLELGGKSMPAHFDLGADGEIVVPKAVADQLEFDGEPKVLHIARTNFNEIELKGGPIKGTATIGPLKIDHPIVTFANIFRTANFGRKMMQGHTFIFDRANKRLQID